MATAGCSEIEKLASFFINFYGAMHDVHAVQKTRDPRFDDLSGSLNEDLFRKSYPFIEEKRNTELKAVKDGTQQHHHT